MRAWFLDARYAARALRRNPVLTAVAVLSLAIGIGANTAIFSLMEALLYRSLPVRAPERLVLLKSPGGWSGTVETSYGDAVSLSWPKYRALADQSSAVFEGLMARFPFAASIAARSQTDAGSGEMVTGNYFDLLGVRPALGRVLSEADTKTRGGSPVAVLSYGYWTRRFGGDPGVLNQSIVVNAVPLTVVGVTQKGFRSAGSGEAPDVFAPITLEGELTPAFSPVFDNPHAYWVNVFGRLRDGVSREQAATRIAPVWARILQGDADRLPPRASREKYLKRPLELAAGGNGISAIRNDFEAPLYLLMGMVGLVLLLACANVANLLLARAAARGREIAIRMSLGASRGRLVRDALTESVLLSLAGGIGALAVASFAAQLIVRTLPANMSGAELVVEMDGRVLAFTFLVSVATGLLFGSAPAWRTTNPDVANALKAGANAPRGHARFRQTLVAGQIAISALLLVSAGLFAQSMRNLRTLDPGFRAGELVSFSVNPRLIGYSSDRSKRLFEDVGRELRAVSGVSAVTMAKWPMLAGMMDISGYEMVDGSTAAVSQNYVGVGFFGSIGMPLISGREFADGDAAGAPGVAIVNEEFVRRFLPDRSPLGVRLNTRRAKKPLEIVGVVKDAKSDDLKERTKPFIYLPEAQDGAAGPMTFYVRTRLEPGGLANSIRAIVGRLDSTLPVSGPQTVRQQIEDSVFLDRMISALALVFALIATTLAAIGLYGVVAWAVARRRREIGIRMALGAAPGSIVRMVLTEVAALAGVGIAIAIPLWVVSGRLVHSLLFGVTERDPSAFVLAVAVLAATAGAAGMVPAWRAARIDPSLAMRND